MMDSSGRGVGFVSWELQNTYEIINESAELEGSGADGEKDVDLTNYHIGISTFNNATCTLALNEK